MGCLRPCGIQSGQQKTLKEEIEEFQKLAKINKKIVEAKKFIKQLMLKKNQGLFEIIIDNWIKPEMINQYLEEKEKEAAEKLRLKMLAEAGDSKHHKGSQAPKRKPQLVP